MRKVAYQPIELIAHATGQCGLHRWTFVSVRSFLRAVWGRRRGAPREFLWKQRFPIEPLFWPSKAGVVESSTLEGVDFGEVQPQAHECFDDHVEGDDVWKQNQGGSLCKVSLKDDEIRAPKAHVYFGCSIGIVISHPKPGDEEDETRKTPLPSTPTIGVMKPPVSNFV